MKFPSTLFKHTNWLQALWGIALVAVLITIVAALTKSRVLTSQTLSSRSGQFAQLQPQQDDDNTNNVYLPLIADMTDGVDVSPQPVVDYEDLDISNWNVYTDEVAGFSFRYPETWRVAESSPGIGVRVMKEYGDSGYQRHRSISFDIETLTSNSRSTEETSQLVSRKIEERVAGRSKETLAKRPFILANIDGFEVTNLDKFMGLHTMTIFFHKDKVFIASLVEGGVSEQGFDYEDSTAKEDYHLFHNILKTVEFTSK